MSTELKRIEDQRARNEARTVEQANQIADVLRQAELSFDVKSGPTGALFGSVTTTDIADRIWADHKIRVDRKKIDTDSIRRIGRYSVPIQLFENVTVEVKTLVVPEGGELPPEEELAAMEAAEAEVQAAAQAEAEAHRAEAEAALEIELEEEPEAPAQTPAEAAAEADDAPQAEAEPEPEARARARARGPERARGDRGAVAFPQRAPQTCGARCELPALSGRSGHVRCGRARTGAAPSRGERRERAFLLPANRRFRFPQPPVNPQA